MLVIFVFFLIFIAFLVIMASIVVGNWKDKHDDD
jgi:hypothetical protein